MPKKLIRIEASHSKLLRIYYDLGNVCNYKCHYCFPGSNDGSTGWPDSEKIKTNLVHLINYYHKTKLVSDIELHFLGGEPTLWPRISEVVEYLSSHTKVRIYVLTNGSRTMRWWKENAKYFDYIEISVHHERADIPHLIELGNFLYDSDIKFHTSVLMDHTHWDKCLDIVNQLKATDKKWLVLTASIHLNGVSQYNDNQLSYLKDQIKRFPAFKDWFKFLKLKRKKFKAHFNDGSVVETKNDAYFHHNFLNRYKGWECTLGINYVMINRQGEVTGSCGQKLYGLDYYHNIYDNDFVEKFSPEIFPVTCEQNICSCTGESALSKWKKI